MDASQDPRTRKGQETRRAFMEAGFRLFARKGFLRTQIGDIAQEAGKSNGALYIYFKNKDELLDAWVDECDKAVPWYYAETSLLFEKAHDFILKSYWDLYERFGPVVDALGEAALVNDHFRQRLESIQSKGQDAFMRLIANGQTQGRYCGVDPELTAVSLAALISSTTAYWFKHRAALEARGFDGDAAMRNLEALYRRILPDSSVKARRRPAGALRR